MSLLKFSPSSQSTQLKHKIREKLKKSINVKYIIRTKHSKDLVKKQIFIDIITKLIELEDKREFLLEELGVNLTEYEQGFYEVIDNLLNLHYNKKQKTLIDLYLYGDIRDKDWDGYIKILHNGEETSHLFDTPDHLWNIIQTLTE